MNPNVQQPYYRNLNMLNGVADPTPIYKFMPFRYALLMILKNTLTIGKIKEWPDVYENYVLKQKFYFQQTGEPLDVFNQADGIFGQCWSEVPESDAMWRIYSPDLDTIRIRTTVEKLYDTIYVNDQCMADTYIGRVEYKPQIDIDTDVQALSPLDFSNLILEIKNCAFVKRIEFDHEHEVRIVKILDSQHARNNGPLLTYPLVPGFIEELTIDPRASVGLVDQLRDLMVAVGANPNLINQSNLYQFTPHRILMQ